jgi:hypothetical protein
MNLQSKFFKISHDWSYKNVPKHRHKIKVHVRVPICEKIHILKGYIQGMTDMHNNSSLKYKKESTVTDHFQYT